MRRSKGYTDELEKLTRDDSDLTLTVKLKAAAIKKLRLRVTGYSQAECYYTLSNRGMIMSYKNCGISKEIDIAAYHNSSNINEVIRIISNLFIFFYEKILHAQKSPKSPKSKQATFTQMFFTHIKSIKNTKA